jgi:demethylmenaquinone methyltransferase/2-methoxy-6-polyprenyl-1,4-benzoquinol methylase
MEKQLRKKYLSVQKASDAQKIQMVKEIFSTITGKYDFLNHFLSVGQDIAWRKYAARKMRFFKTFRFLDVATGTSDLAIEATRLHPDIQVLGIDFTGEMLRLGQKKIEKKGLSTQISLLKGDALNLPVASNSFDAVGIAFGIRNIPDRLGALKEMARVVVPTGGVFVLEMTLPQNRLFQSIYDVYLNRLLPFLARMFSPNPDAYYYLGDSIMNFPTVPEFKNLMQMAGLENIKDFSLTKGITRLFVGYKPG